MSSNAVRKLDIQPAPTSSSAEEELRLIQKKYDELSQQMDEILSQTMERSNRIVMEAEISNLIMNQGLMPPMTEFGPLTETIRSSG